MMSPPHAMAVFIVAKAVSCPQGAAILALEACRTSMIIWSWA